MTFKAAAVNFKIRPIRSDGQFWSHTLDLISEAHTKGASLVVLPEFFCVELLHLAKDLAPEKAPRYLIQYSDAIESWLQRIAENSGLVIVGGSHFKEIGGRIRNVSPIAFPDGSLRFQEKNNLTRYEIDPWDLERGHGLAALPGALGVTICYDTEFPEAGRALTEAGMLVHCVPAWTETQRGFQRVRWSCLARSVENQTFVVHASLVGDLGREPIPENYGSSAVIAPSTEPFQVSAILAETPLNEEGVAIAELDLEALTDSRNRGDVRPWMDRHQGDWTVATDPGDYDSRSIVPWYLPVQDA